MEFINDFSSQRYVLDICVIIIVHVVHNVCVLFGTSDLYGSMHFLWTQVKRRRRKDDKVQIKVKYFSQ